MKLAIGFYALVVALLIPALLTNYWGVCAAYAKGASCWLDIWDFYESTFIVIALLDFIPLAIVAELLPRNGLLHRVGFMVTGAWMLIMAMPDIYISYVPWAYNLSTWLWYYSDYNAHWFGDASLTLLFLNLYFFTHIVLKSKRIV